MDVSSTSLFASTVSPTLFWQHGLAGAAEAFSGADGSPSTAVKAIPENATAKSIATNEMRLYMFLPPLVRNVDRLRFDFGLDD